MSLNGTDVCWLYSDRALVRLRFDFRLQVTRRQRHRKLGAAQSITTDAASTALSTFETRASPPAPVYLNEIALSLNFP